MNNNANKNYDVIICGSGIAGLYSALSLSRDLNILILTKKGQFLCNSDLAQGGIAGVYKSPTDSPLEHKKDTLIAGGNQNDVDALDIMVNEAYIDIDNIINLGVEFDKSENGDFHRTLEGGHSAHRIFHHTDATGHEMVQKLAKRVSELSNVTVLENALVCDIKKTSTGFSFDVLVNNVHTYYNSHYTILATGGIGRIYKYTTNSSIATGDGIAFAHNLGAKIKNLSYIQFHPTAFNNRETRECFLISEAVRGEGAYLKNCNKERFMHLYDERKELAPRDVVSNSIIKETKRTGSDNFFLDITHEDSDFIKERFPMIYKNLLKQGFDLTTDLIPIYPCQHYLMGGIEVDTNSETGIENLFACGECSCTGVHGNNRLASNSLLEALVFSRRAANVINEKFGACNKNFEEYNFKENTSSQLIPKGLRTKIRTAMQESYFVVPNKEKLAENYNTVKEIKELLENGNFIVDSDYVIAKSLATLANIIFEEVLEK